MQTFKIRVIKCQWIRILTTSMILVKPCAECRCESFSGRKRPNLGEQIHRKFWRSSILHEYLCINRNWLNRSIKYTKVGSTLQSQMTKVLGQHQAIRNFNQRISSKWSQSYPRWNIKSRELIIKTMNTNWKMAGFKSLILHSIVWQLMISLVLRRWTGEQRHRAWTQEIMMAWALAITIYRVPWLRNLELLWPLRIRNILPNLMAKSTESLGQDSKLDLHTQLSMLTWELSNGQKQQEKQTHIKINKIIKMLHQSDPGQNETAFTPVETAPTPSHRAQRILHYPHTYTKWPQWTCTKPPEAKQHTWNYLSRWRPITRSSSSSKTQKNWQNWSFSIRNQSLHWGSWRKKWLHNSRLVC